MDERPSDLSNDVEELIQRERLKNQERERLT